MRLLMPLRYADADRRADSCSSVGLIREPNDADARQRARQSAQRSSTARASAQRRRGAHRVRRRGLDVRPSNAAMTFANGASRSGSARAPLHWWTQHHDRSPAPAEISSATLPSHTRGKPVRPWVDIAMTNSDTTRRTRRLRSPLAIEQSPVDVRRELRPEEVASSSGCLPRQLREEFIPSDRIGDLGAGRSWSAQAADPA